MKTLLKEIARRWIIGNPVKIGQRFEGQGITKGNAYLLGCYAGPDQNVEYLLHEMAHLSEREEDKVIKRPYQSWGFSQGKYWEVPGYGSGWEPQTEQSVLREARVWAFQANLQQELNMKVDVEDLVASAVYLPAYCYFKFKRVNKNLGYKESEEAGLAALATHVKNLMEEFTFQKWEENWFKRMDLLKNNVVERDPIIRKYAKWGY
jgi:hypothetical protein